MGYLIIALSLVCQVNQPQISQVGSDWIIEYRNLKPFISISYEISGFVSNSRVPGHSIPKKSTLTGDRNCELISDINDEIRCREKISLENIRGFFIYSYINNVKFIIHHEHGIYGVLNPLFGRRKIKLILDDKKYTSIANFNEQEVYYPPTNLEEIPEERREKSYYISPPDSLYLGAHSSNRYYRFREKSVRYSSQMRLTFYYMIATNTEVECGCRIFQYKDLPTSWKKIDNHCYEFKLEPNKIGWKKVEYLFKTAPEATSITIEFKMSGESEVGEMWVDDINLEYLNIERKYEP